jgi:hypothetical protein
MAATSPSSPKPGTESTPAPLTFEDKLQHFWQQNRMIVLGLCALVLIAILAKGGWERYQAGRERDVEAAYAAATTTEQLRSFIAAHPDHELAGVAELRIADEAYAAGKSADAVAGYDKAVATLKTGPLATRAQLGRALAKIQSGNATDGANELKQIANDSAQLKTARAEAAYHLASLAAESNNAADVQKYADQLEQIDPASTWARRAMMLRATLPVPAAPAPAAATSSESTKAGGPSLEVNLPKK